MVSLSEPARGRGSALCRNLTQNPIVDASRRMSDAFLVRWNYAGKTSLSNCIGVSVLHIVIVAKTTGLRPNVPIKPIIPCTCTNHVHEALLMGFVRENPCVMP